MKSWEKRPEESKVPRRRVEKKTLALVGVSSMGFLGACEVLRAAMMGVGGEDVPVDASSVEVLAQGVGLNVRDYLLGLLTGGGGAGLTGFAMGKRRNGVDR